MPGKRLCALHDELECLVDGCDGEAGFESGLCAHHRQRVRRYGVPEPGEWRRKSFAERWAEMGKPTAPDACWYWTGPLDKGYGRTTREADGRRVKCGAHVAAWVAENGEPPPGLDIGHLCHDRDMACPGGPDECLHRRCIRPLHLAPQTRRDNLLAIGRRRLLDTCP